MGRVRSVLARMPRLLFLLLYAVLCVGVALYLVSFAIHAKQVLSFPYPLDYGEGPLLTQSNLLQNGMPIWKLYGDPTEPPYVVVNYPPLYLLLVAATSTWTGMDALLVGRLVSLLATFGAGAAIAVLSTPDPRYTSSAPHPATDEPRPPTFDPRPAPFVQYLLTPDPRLLLPLLFLTVPIVREWSVMMRVDMTGVCLGLWALVALRFRAPFLAGLLLLLTVLTKPSLLAAPVAAFLWMAIEEVRSTLFALRVANRQAFLNMLLVVGIAGCLSYVLLQSPGHGWFTRHVLNANANRWEASLALSFWAQQAAIRLPLALAALVGVVLCVRNLPLRDAAETTATRHDMLAALHAFDVPHGKPIPPDTSIPQSPTSLFLLPLLYTLVGGLLAIGVGKVGAYSNYFLELYAGLVWLIATAAHLLPLVARRSHLTIWRWALPVLLLASLYRYPPLWDETALYRAGTQEPVQPGKVSELWWDDLEREAEILAALERIHEALGDTIRATDTPILTDIPGVVARTATLARIQAFEHRQLYDQGMIDPRPLLLDLANGKIDLAVINYLGNWITPAMVDIIEHRYAQDGSLGIFDLYRPVDPGPRFPMSHPFGEELVLMGYHLGAADRVPQVAAGELLPLTLEWQRRSDASVSRTPNASPAEQRGQGDEGIVVVVRLTDEAGGVVLQTGRALFYGALAPNDMPPGTNVQHMHPLALPHNLAEGRYYLDITLQYNGSPLAPSHRLTMLLVGPSAGHHFEQNDRFVPAPLFQKWRALGGADRVGLPLTPAVPFAWGTLQCFEYTCLEQRDGEVVQRPLGEQLYLAETLRSTTCPTTDTAISQLHPIPHTGTAALSRLMVPSLCPGFHDLWQQHRGAELGEPISGEIERNKLLVQWTRYARLERAPGGGYVGIGRLGDDVQRLPPGMRYRWQPAEPE